MKNGVEIGTVTMSVWKYSFIMSAIAMIVLWIYQTFKETKRDERQFWRTK